MLMGRSNNVDVSFPMTDHVIGGIAVVDMKGTGLGEEYGFAVR